MPNLSSPPKMRAHPSTSASESEEEETNSPVELLAVGRAKRSTAGNRLSSLVHKEQDDEIELLFAEDELEEDESFGEDEEDASDVNMGSSSSDDEDQDAAQGEDDLVGEKELQRNATDDKRKRKAKELARRPGINRKRVKIDPTALRAQPSVHPRQKKSERTSWIANAADAPTRVSSRKQTVQNREIVHKRLVDNERQRARLMRQMEEAQRRKESAKPKALTQAQRFEEAAKMERKNAKSLTRWQESEAKRVADQKAKLEALHHRQLSGPVVSWWSGLVQWVNGRVARLGMNETKNSQDSLQSPKQDDRKNPGTDNVSSQSILAQGEHVSLNSEQVRTNHSIPSTDLLQLGPQPFQLAQPQASKTFLDGIHAYAALPNQDHAVPDTQNTSSNRTTISQGLDVHASPLTDVPSQSLIHHDSQPYWTSRNLVALKNVDANAQKIPELQDGVLVKKHKPKLQSEFSKLRCVSC